MYGIMSADKIIGRLMGRLMIDRLFDIHKRIQNRNNTNLTQEDEVKLGNLKKIKFLAEHAEPESEIMYIIIT